MCDSLYYWRSFLHKTQLNDALKESCPIHDLVKSIRARTRSGFGVPQHMPCWAGGGSATSQNRKLLLLLGSSRDPQHVHNHVHCRISPDDAQYFQDRCFTQSGLTQRIVIPPRE